MSATLTATAVRRWGHRVRAVDLMLAALLVGYGVAASVRDPLLVHPAAELTVCLMAGSLALRTRSPLLMAGVAAVGATGYALLPNPSTPLWTFLTVLVVAFSAGANLEGRRRWVALGVLLASAYVLQLASVDRGDPSDDTFTEIFVSPLVIILGPALAGGLLRRSRAQNAELRRLTLELAGEREQHAEAAVAAERDRIARELHDVVSHAVTVMVVQAGAAEQLLAPGEAAREHVHAVRSTGKEALAELRRQLGLLRAWDPASASPLPGLADVPALVARAGAELTLEPGDPAALSPGLGLTVYRVVQEGLTNARRHAPAATVRVRLTRRPDDLRILVEDDGPGASVAEGSGSGLRGMRERVGMYGGRLDVGPREDGRGWRVDASLPLPARGSLP
jgi:signal transduction histidine kinase